ncbi:MAG: DUF6599 family protein [Polyangiaceae bacterium]
MSVPVMALSLACVLSGACNSPSSHGTPPPPQPAPASDAAAEHADLCAGGGGQDIDAISAPFVPRAGGGYCLDPQGEPKTYGDKGKFSMDEVCTTAFDGECDVYKRFGLDRLVLLRYVDGSGAPNSVELSLSRFATVDGAYSMFTKRVVADADPAQASVKPLTAGGAAALGSSNAYVWRGVYLAELTFVSEDPKMTPAMIAAANGRSTALIAREIGSKLPGPLDLPASAAALPTASRIALGVAYHPKDALGISGIGPVAVGYYREGDKRWRCVALVRSDVEGAKEAMRAFKLKGGGASIKGVGDDAVFAMLQDASERSRTAYVIARKGTLVAAIGDEEFAAGSEIGGDAAPAIKLSKEEKVAKLASWVK